jgi:hypothetical protein
MLPAQMSRRIKIFLSHAWEDKSFVRELYEAMEEDFDVWYDEARVTLGDSIYEKISEGIRECDFGVVVFSPSFLEKNWTQEEFNGLKALQTEKRKIILPILHGLTIEQLRAKWPIEAGKLSINSSKGVPTIVQAIRAAVGADQENKEFEQDALRKAFGDFRSAKELERTNERLSMDRAGAEKAELGAIDLLRLIKTRVDELSAGSTWITASLNTLHGRPVSNRRLVVLRAGEYQNIIEYFNQVYNATTSARLSVAFVHFEPFADNFTVIREHVLRPLFTLREEVVWGFTDPREGKPNAQVADKLIKDFLEFLREVEGGQL